MTPSEIELANLQVVTQYLKHLRQRVPLSLSCNYFN